MRLGAPISGPPSPRNPQAGEVKTEKKSSPRQPIQKSYSDGENRLAPALKRQDEAVSSITGRARALSLGSPKVATELPLKRSPCLSRRESSSSSASDIEMPSYELVQRCKKRSKAEAEKLKDSSAQRQQRLVVAIQKRTQGVFLRSPVTQNSIPEEGDDVQEG